jgi:hypothetical protein
MNKMTNYIQQNLNSIFQRILFTFKNIDGYTYGDKNKNTVLLFEPRFKPEARVILANTH